MAHLEKHILNDKKMSKDELKKEAREELEEVAKNPKKEGKEARAFLGQKKAIEEKVAEGEKKMCPHCGKEL